MTTKNTKAPGPKKSIGFPTQGVGQRAMSCDCYDTCLHKAAVQDWDSFHCENCSYENRGVIEFIEPVFTPELEDDHTVYESDKQLIDLFSHTPFLTAIKENLTHNDESA